jgi:hypothetical protein
MINNKCILMTKWTGLAYDGFHTEVMYDICTPFSLLVFINSCLTKS